MARNRGCGRHGGGEAQPQVNLTFGDDNEKGDNIRFVHLDTPEMRKGKGVYYQ